MESRTVTAVGAWFYSTDTNRYLYLMRRDTRNPGTWGLPGGKIENNESLLAALTRECQEELGFMPQCENLIPLEKFTGNDGKFIYHTFFAVVLNEFQPVLNNEHLGYAWIESGNWPRPMHPGLWNTVNFEVVQQKILTIQQRIHQTG